MATQAAKNVKCQTKRKQVAAPETKHLFMSVMFSFIVRPSNFLPEYMQNMVTDGKGLKIPIQKLKKSVTEVIVIETAASLNIWAILSGTGVLMDVRLHAANITKVSSMPIPENY